MPGPPLSDTFTYDGTPGHPKNSDPSNTLAREVVQSNRFFQPLQIGTHSRQPERVHIPRNSDNGVGAGEGGIISEDRDNADLD
jgi:hypothetical protein